MCVLVQGKLLNKSKALKLALAFAERSPTRAAYRWVTRVASAGSDADAAGDAWAASDTSAFSMVYASGPDFDNSIYAIELRWQAEKIKQIVGNPFKASESNKME